MSDQFDRASELEQSFRDKSIANAREAPKEQAFEQDGQRLCLSCASVISAKRIEFVPNAVRCAFCQSQKEAGYV